MEMTSEKPYSKHPYNNYSIRDGALEKFPRYRLRKPVPAMFLRDITPLKIVEGNRNKTAYCAHYSHRMDDPAIVSGHWVDRYNARVGYFKIHEYSDARDFLAPEEFVTRFKPTGERNDDGVPLFWDRTVYRLAVVVDTVTLEDGKTEVLTIQYGDGETEQLTIPERPMIRGYSAEIIGRWMVAFNDRHLDFIQVEDMEKMYVPLETPFEVKVTL